MMPIVRRGLGVLTILACAAVNRNAADVLVGKDFISANAAVDLIPSTYAAPEADRVVAGLSVNFIFLTGL